MGKDAGESTRRWRRHLRDVARVRNTKGPRGSGTLFFSARELGTLAVNGIEWMLYAFLTWGVIYLALTDRAPRATPVVEQLEKIRVASTESPRVLAWEQRPIIDEAPLALNTHEETFRMATDAERNRCLDVVDRATMIDITNSPPEFQRGFEAAVQIITQKLEGTAK